MRAKRKKHCGPGRGVDQPYVEGTTYNPHLKAAILEVVENLIRDHKLFDRARFAALLEQLG